MTIYPPLKQASVYGYQRPIKSLKDLAYVIAKSGQGFGVDQSGPACEWDKKYPCDITFYQALGLGAHNGLDIPCETGTPVYASHDGAVVELSDDLTAGLGIVLWDEEQKVKTVYWHFQKNTVSMGQKVSQGTILGYADNTGYSKGSHLHFMLKFTDEQGNTINKDNGYFGAVDPLPHLSWFENMLTKEQVKKLQALEGYNDLEGVEFWTGKELDQYLAARIPDKIATLQKSLNEQ